VPPFFVLALGAGGCRFFNATTKMNDIHDHLWAYLKALRNSEAIKEWLYQANILLKRNGLPTQITPLDAQRMLKNINKHFMFIV